jgi:hypothetical protein
MKTKATFSCRREKAIIYLTPQAQQVGWAIKTGAAIMRITLEGIPPFELPVVQNATARSQGETVEMTLYVLADGKQLVPIHVPMTVATARTLASQLASAAIQAELAAARK